MSSGSLSFADVTASGAAALLGSWGCGRQAPRLISAAEIATVIIDGQHVIIPVSVYKNVQNLRRKLSQSRLGQRAVVETVRGFGYRVVRN